VARTLTKDDIARLPASERRDLISDLWDSLSPADVPVPDSHRRALDEALEEYASDPEAGEGWPSVRDKLFPKK
jgi:putative addiction module component (TIGR02574 family)